MFVLCLSFGFYVSALCLVFSPKGCWSPHAVQNALLCSCVYFKVWPMVPPSPSLLQGSCPLCFLTTPTLDLSHQPWASLSCCLLDIPTCQAGERLICNRSIAELLSFPPKPHCPVACTGSPGAAPISFLIPGSTASPSRRACASGARQGEEHTRS